VKKTSLPQSAFTLVEVIIGVAILSIVMSSITVLTIVSIQANQANVNRLTGYYLAQEGVEGLRNLRDSNWLRNYGWDGNSEWGSDFGSEGYYKIDYLPGLDPPWKLTFGGTVLANLDSTLYLVNHNGNRFYVHDPSTWTDYETTKFNRHLHVVPDADEEMLQVTAVVFWDDHGREIEVQVSTRLTDWREGPI